MKQLSLDQQIAELKAEHSFKATIAEMLPEYKYLAYISGNNKRLVVTCPTIENVKHILSLFPATNKTHTVGNDNKLIKSPFRVDIDNPANTNTYHWYTLSLSYKSNNIDVKIETPIEQFESFVLVGKRKVYDSEHHYFTGMSYDKIYNLRIKMYRFDAMNDEQINWYGGNVTLTSDCRIGKIIEFINK